MKKKKIIYISNVNLDGPFLPGVIHKIKGQELAFKNMGYEIDLLYSGTNNIITLKKNSGENLTFKGARDTYTEGGLFAKISQHYQNSRFGSINFSECLSTIIDARYDVIYFRFYLPGKDTISFFEKIKKACPNIIILIEYPTSNINKLSNASVSSKLSYFMNFRLIQRLNKLSNFFITLTKDKTLFGKPAIFMANGITLGDIEPVGVPDFNTKIILLGVASDCAFYHGFDKVIKGLAVYAKQDNGFEFLFRIITNPLSSNVKKLKSLAEDLGVAHMVSFELPKSRMELAEEYRNVHIGIGTLALHRVGLMDNYSLKHREYAAFGLPFVMSKGDFYFENSPFVQVVERDEAPLDLQRVADFYISLRNEHPYYTSDFRKSVEHFITWEAQMENIFAVINKT